VTPLEDAPHYSERIAQLPNCYQPNDRRRALPDPMPRWQCGLPDVGFVFCCFNSNYKISEPVFERWCRILNAVPGSVMWLFEANPQAKASLLAHAARRGVEASRFVFAPFLGISAHLARLRNADLFLDTVPYNAHTTGSDALWAGVPLLTCTGETFAGRVAASLLRAVGLPELVTASLADYEARAVELAKDRAQLTALRRRLDGARRTAPLFDGQRSARDLESLYLRMVERQRAGLAPDHLPS
jgi:predicted O-linked N-acetylglucosamine transferase (SPINDLY family)